jgi:hypothetical protein
LPGAQIDAMAVRSYLGQHLARYKVPKVVALSDHFRAKTRARSSSASYGLCIGKRQGAASEA